MLNKLHAPAGNMQIFIRIRIHILHVVQSAILDNVATPKNYTIT